MNPRVKNALYTLLLLVLMVAVYVYRNGHAPQAIRIEGETMATTYHVTYFDGQNRNLKASIDSLLIEVNKSINTYDSTSEVSRFNRSSRAFTFERPHFFEPLRVSRGVVNGSLGAYDPTVMPLVNAWGFGPRKVERPDTAEIEVIRSFVGFEKINFDSDSVWKLDPRVQIDFGGIGQGYGADVIAAFLRSRGIADFFVELGGEGVASGGNIAEDRPWEIGILDPNSDHLTQQFMARAILGNEGFSTSGNYFNYRVVDGKKYSHTIDPITGFPVQRALLSATVFAPDCSTADAWATAFMVMGHEKAIAQLPQHPELSVFFVFSGEQGLQTFVSESRKGNITVTP